MCLSVPQLLPKNTSNGNPTIDLMYKKRAKQKQNKKKQSFIFRQNKILLTANVVWRVILNKGH